MKRLIVLAFLNLGSMSAVAGEPVDVHWYQLTVMDTPSSRTFVGSSALNAAQLARYIINGIEPITLDNLRNYYATASDLPLSWHPAREITNVVVVPKAVLYFSELPSDPAAGKK